MGVLGSQPPRDGCHVSQYQMKAFLHEARYLAEEYGVKIETVIEARRVLEYGRRTTVMVHDGDSHDEHLGGFAKILSGRNYRD